MFRHWIRSRSARWLAAPAALASAAALLGGALTASPASAAGYTQLYPGYTGPIYGYGGQCLDDRGNILANLNPVQLYPCTGSPAQQWTVGSTSAGTIIVLESTVTNATSLCLDAAGQSLDPGTPVEIYQCNGGPNQIWQAQEGGALENQYTGSKACLDDPAFSTNQAQLQLWTCNGGDNQVWLGGA